MQSESAPRSSADYADFQRCCQDFLKGLATHDYAKATIRQYECTVDFFCEEIRNQNISSYPIKDSVVTQLQESAFGTPKSSGHRERRLAKLVKHLTDAGMIELPRTMTKALSPRECLRNEYEKYLRVQRGLSDSTVYHSIRLYEQFVTFRFGEELGDLSQITPDDIVTFLLKITRGPRPSRCKTQPTHLRSLLKFLFWSEKTTANLTNCVPRVAQPQPTNLPRYLPPSDIQRLLKSVRSDSDIGRRNYAMLLLMARLGLRATEVIAIRLEDINWRSGEILIRGKGKQHDRMPLPPDVGESLAKYIKQGRKGVSRVLFVSQKAPHEAFVDGQIINNLLRQAFAATGLKPPQKHVGSHLLRHSLATDMLRNGASLDEISDTLRHRSRVTTMIYAKHDIDALRSITQEWPTQGETP